MTEPPPVIIEVALNGATTKNRNPNVPRSPSEVAEDGLRCLEAGAAIVHNHNDEPVVGGRSGVHSPEPYLEAWRAILANRPDALLYPTMASGGAYTTIEERYAHIPALAEAGVLRIGLADPGCVNIGPCDAEGLPINADLTYVNTFRDARYMFETCERYQLGRFLRRPAAEPLIGEVARSNASARNQQHGNERAAHTHVHRAAPSASSLIRISAR